MKNTSQAYGQELAHKVYAYLERHLIIRYDHIGYCGTGFVLRDNKILYTHFDEWNLYTQSEIYQPGGDYIGIIKSFESKEDFIAWLAEQSDDSLSGKESGDDWYINNQRITQKRLEYILNEQNL